MVSLIRQNAGQTPSDYLDSIYDDVVLPYAADRWGMTEDNHSREDIIRAVEKNMRRFNAGNSVRTLNELNYLSRSEDKNIPLRMYDAWDASPSAYGSGDGWGATRDYAMAILADPANALALGAGRLAGGVATRGAKDIAITTAREAGEIAARRAAAQGADKAAQDAARRRTFAEAQRQILNRAGSNPKIFEAPTVRTAVRNAQGRVGNVGRRDAMADIAGTTAADTAINTGVDRAYQQVNIETGRADGWDPMQSLLAASMGLVGGAAATGLQLLKGSSGLAVVSREMEAKNRANRLRELRSQREASKRDVKALAKASDKNTIRLGLQNLKREVSEFKRKVKLGREAEEEGLDPDMSSAKKLLTLRTIMLGDSTNPDSTGGLMGVFQRAGVPAFVARNDQDNITNWIGDVARSLPKGLRNDIEDIIDTELGELDGVFKGMKLKRFFEYEAKEVSNAGVLLNIKSQQARLARQLGKKPDELTTQELLDDTFGLIRRGREVDPEETTVGWMGRALENGQRNYISMLITHPATTAVNIVGSATAAGMQFFSDLTKGVLYAGAAPFASIFGKKGNLQRAKGLWTLQLQRARNLIDPYTTHEAFMNYITLRPELQKDMFNYLSGGVETSKALKGMGIEPDAAADVDLTATEKFIRTFQTAYGVRAQDFFFKSQEFMYHLDKQIRQRYGKSYSEFMRDTDFGTLMDDPEAWAEFRKIEVRATQQSLKNVFSAKYGDLRKGNTGLPSRTVGEVANFIEELRKWPVIGAIVPFGQFFNNTIGYMADYSGISFASHSLHKLAGRTVGPREADPLEMFAKATVGLTAVNFMAQWEMPNLEEGLAWYEERVNGTVLDRRLDFPYSIHKFVGRLLAHHKKDGEIPPELLDEFGRTFGWESLFRTLGDSNQWMGEFIRELVTSDDPAYSSIWEGTKEVGSAVASTYASGMTRFVDPANQVMALYRGDDYVAIDRQQGSKHLNNAVRYIDQFIEGVRTLPEREQALTGTKTVPQTSRMLGFRESLPATNIQKMFNEIGRPHWIDSIQLPQSQEAENILRGEFFPFVESLAEQAYNNPNWETLNVAQKTEAIDRIMSIARERTLNRLEGVAGPDYMKTALIRRITQKGLRSTELQEALEMFGVSPDEIWQLDVGQLRYLLQYIGLDSTRDRMEDERLGISK